jgi:hypothetical protein
MSENKIGLGSSCIGGVLTLFAFLALPVLNFGILGSVTALTYETRTSNQNIDFWVVALCATLATCIAGLQLFTDDNPSPIRGIFLTMLGIIPSGLLIAEYVLDGSESYLWIPAVNFIGYGFWVMLFGSLLVILGGGIEVRAGANRASSRRGARQ